MCTEITSRGYYSTKNVYYFGLKLHVVAFRRKGTIPFPEMLILSAADENDSTVFKRECVGNLNNREIYADKIYSDMPFYKETKESKKLELFTPVKAIKGESPEITKREKAARDLFSTAVSKVRQLIESLFNWLNEKTNIQSQFKIGRDNQNTRLTYMKITGGSLKVKQILEGLEWGKEEKWSEKADQLRFYSGNSYEMKETAIAGQICAVTGLSKTYAGEALGAEREDTVSVLEPVLTYRLELPENENMHQAYEKIQLLAQEDPGLHLEWKEKLGEIHIKVMGDIQIEVLKQVIRERFGMEVEFGSGHIVYKETIENIVEGVGHFEPLRHYAEVHLLLEPWCI